jgi:hypothetical protein
MRKRGPGLRARSPSSPPKNARQGPSPCTPSGSLRSPLKPPSAQAFPAAIEQADSAKVFSRRYFESLSLHTCAGRKCAEPGQAPCPNEAGARDPLFHSSRLRPIGPAHLRPAQVCRIAGTPSAADRVSPPHSERQQRVRHFEIPLHRDHRYCLSKVVFLSLEHDSSTESDCS